MELTKTHSSPTSWGTTVGTSPQLVFPGVGSGGGMIICNAGQTVLTIWPEKVTVGELGVFNSGPSTPEVGTGGTAGGITLAAGERFLIDTLLCTAPWHGVSDAEYGVITFLVF